VRVSADDEHSQTVNSVFFGTLFIGSIGLAIIALAAHVAMIHFIGGAFTISGTGAGTSI
jgi:hypothetical protein